MAYRRDRAEDERIRKRIKSILQQKNRHPDYTGGVLTYGSAVDPRRRRAGKRAAKDNPWMKFYKAYAKRNRGSGKSGAELAKEAGRLYRGGSTSGGRVLRRRRRRPILGRRGRGRRRMRR